MKYDFGLVGLGVMGRNFILNVAENGFSAIGLSSKKESIEKLENDGKDFVVKGTSKTKIFIESPKIYKPNKEAIKLTGSAIARTITALRLPNNR